MSGITYLPDFVLHGIGEKTEELFIIIRIAMK